MVDGRSTFEISNGGIVLERRFPTDANTTTDLITFEGMEEIKLNLSNGGTGNDVTILGTPAVPFEIIGSDGNDIVNVGGNGTLADVAGDLSFFGRGG